MSRALAQLWDTRLEADAAVDAAGAVGGAAAAAVRQLAIRWRGSANTAAAAADRGHGELLVWWVQLAMHWQLHPMDSRVDRYHDDHVPMDPIAA